MMNLRSTIAGLILFFCVATIMADDFLTFPKGTYEQRRQQYLDYCAKEGSKGGRDGVFNEIARIQSGLQVKEEIIRESVDFIYTGRDCNDFSVNGLVRLLYLNKQKPVLSQQLEKDLKACLLDFKYWWDDTRKDKVYRCYHTENHQALCHTAELLAGQLYPDEVFGNGMNGEEHIKHAYALLDQWLNYRIRFGFSEWLSNNYYEVDVMLLANLHDFAEDESLKAKAGMLLDLLMFDIAINNYKGVFGSTHGRTYAPSVKGGRAEPTSSITKLVFGVGNFNSSTNLGAIALSSSSYRCPKVIMDIATDYSQTVRSLQRQSINVEDATAYGLSYGEDNLNLYWGMQEFIHPLVIRTSKKISEKYDVWPYKDYDKYIQIYEDQVKQFGKLVNSHLDRFALSEANIETYRTPDYMLSSVQDYRKGAPGYQQHIWQATLGVDAVVFTTNPGSTAEAVTPNYWAGNASMPRVAQHKNVLVAIYNIPEAEKMDVTHAYFPGYAFDEVIQKGSWIFARKDDGFIALYSCNATAKQGEQQGSFFDLIASGRQNIWVCEMGNKKEWHSLSRFADAIVSSGIKVDSLSVRYNSPSLGSVEFGWEDPFKVKGLEISMNDYPRYENQFCKAAFDAKSIEIKRGNKSLLLDFATGKRIEK